ncbi:hypothetical protein FQI94_21445 [Escherichia coli]|uniref:Uncharacterized protein n=1 Tax=Escherichia coli TaxID=562 RepID=A0A2U2V3B3_ECOLX|nr:hypothetical protein [Salmonella enterica subsp. enterica serovar Typhimurium]ECB3229273.1 hypothetical protein [Salmonella enterica subsp. enterica serovar Kentucky]ECC3180844.1 hypothetical protein [Salmonella enterica subsp. enterica]EEK9354932.1 hypothetical protein [Salmonella enterica]EEU9481664.1 hypothetical protein [Escherichia coli]EFN8409096.1 hypothetical protein [Escherichia coli O15]
MFPEVRVNLHTFASRCHHGLRDDEGIPDFVRYFYFFSADFHKNALWICFLRCFLAFRISFL